MAYDIDDFIREALSKGISKSDIKTALKQEGWSDDEITAGLDSFGDKPISGIAVPRRRTYASAKEGFLYLLMFVTLYISAFHFGNLIFDFINRAFPDQLQWSYDLSSMRFSLASLIVAFPIFLWLTISIRKSITKDPAKQGSKVRKWLIYFTLLIAATTIICDLIGLLVILLGGELSMRFTLKIVTILFIAGLIFGYYRWDLGHDMEKANGR
jgi:hypothetical protein